jgi:DNA polymerase II large subunit
MLTERTQKYFENFDEEVRKIYEIAGEAKKTGLDPIDKIEVPLAKTMAQKCVELIATIYPQMSGCGIDKRILELEEVYGKLDSTVVFRIAEEVAKQKFCKFETLLQAIDAGIRIGFAYITLGVVSSPIEGFTELKTNKTKDGREYFVAYFSGPIRSAGTTAGCLVLILIDYLREMFGYAKYDPTEEEVKRYITENTDYHERITNLQYFPLEAEIEFLARHIPIQISGELTEKIEVSNYKNLPRVETNFIRGGMCLIFSEGLAQKAAKGFRLLNNAKKNGIKSSGFDWIEDYVKLHEKLTSRKSKDEGNNVPVYIKDLVAGRPIFGHPMRSGGFRFRYGRSRTAGFSAVSLHPATMAVTDDFIAIGTQLKIEKPTKGCAVTSCDSIEGPIVKFINGNVLQLKTRDEVKKLYQDIEEIIYLGDMLFPFSDVLNRNSSLIKPGYVEEWWALELKEKNKGQVNYQKISAEDAIGLSKKYRIPLHPKFIFYWTQISDEQFLGLIEWLRYAVIRNKKIIFPFNKTEQEKFGTGKRTLELLGVEHLVSTENVVLDENKSKSLLINLGIDLSLLEKEKFLLKDETEKLIKKIIPEKSVLEIVNELSGFVIKDKAGEFIGTRMGRPEKAKLRKLTGSPNVLFPVGSEGGRLRSLQASCEAGKVRSTFPLFYCEKCNKETIYKKCEACGNKCNEMYYSPYSKEKTFEKKEGYLPYYNKDLDINYYFEKAVSHLGLQKNDLPLLIKGIRGTSSEGHIMENLAKGILRARYGLQVNKDGTIRFDATELPVVSFKPKEISASVEKLISLGYTHDIFGEKLVNDEQILELMPHDIILPCCPESSDEKSDEVFLKIGCFIDELLEKFYKLKPIHNFRKREDLVGQIGVCMAPHNCAGVICRFIGFSKTQGLFASPYMHAAIRRDCDGDEAAIMLLSDVLLNFSKKFLPSHRGGTQDAPLVLNSRIDAGEVDDQILDFELSSGYPLELYELAEKKRHSSEVKSIETIRGILKKGKDPFVNLGFTHDTNNFNDGVLCSSYKLFATMQEKVEHQMALVEKLRCVDEADTARIMIDRHFMRDIRGNLRKFSMQGFRCVDCNEIMRRPPLSGVCPKCGGKIIFTIHEGGIKKYLEIATELAKKYNLSIYMKQNLELVKRYIESIFGKETEKQESIDKWF